MRVCHLKKTEPPTPAEWIRIAQPGKNIQPPPLVMPAAGVFNTDLRLDYNFHCYFKTLRIVVRTRVSILTARD